jgi:hypothetical protein
METFLLACQDVARDIVTALEIGLGLPVGAFTRCMETRVDELRLNYYSPLPIESSTGESISGLGHTLISDSSRCYFKMQPAVLRSRIVRSPAVGSQSAVGPRPKWVSMSATPWNT